MLRLYIKTNNVLSIVEFSPAKGHTLPARRGTKIKTGHGVLVSIVYLNDLTRQVAYFKVL